jgi:GxxExxY protein
LYNGAGRDLQLGNGFQEVIYQRCLAIELDRAEILYQRELDQDIFYEGIQVGTRRADFVVGKTLIVELKARRCAFGTGEELCGRI